MTMTGASLYEQLGGQPAVSALTALLYRKILADPELAGFFAGTDMERQEQHMSAFLTTVTGGPGSYEGRSLRAAHAGLPITEAHFDAVAGHLVASLRELDVSEGTINEVAALAMSVRDDVLGAAPPPAPDRRGFPWRRRK